MGLTGCLVSGGAASYLGIVVMFRRGKFLGS